ncbi:VTC domain-containing protein [Candidatus Neomarinimicrobiota bacterium]
MRQEYKYLVDLENIDELRKYIKPFVIGDDHIRIGKSNEYTVRSIYFDNLYLDEYHKKLSGLYHRRKVRIRGYNIPQDDSMAFLEIKRKIDMSIFKNRAPIMYYDLEKLLHTGHIDKYIQKRGDFPAASENASRFLYHYFRFQLKPVVLVTYEPLFINKFDHSERITFDKFLRSSSYPRISDLYSEKNTKRTLNRDFILEVKSNKGFPAWMKPIINRFGLKREALSKYTMSIDTNTIFPNNYSKCNVVCFENGTKSYNFT